MRLQVRLPQITPDEYMLPERCPHPNCSEDIFKPYGLKGEPKAVRDTNHEQVEAFRYQCVTCGHTFRVYPTGVSPAQQSDRLKAMSVLLYVLGLNYGGTADFLCAIGLPVGKTTVYENVQAMGMVSPKAPANRCKKRWATGQHWGGRHVGESERQPCRRGSGHGRPNG